MDKGQKKELPLGKGSSDVFKWFDLFENYSLSSDAFISVGFDEINTSVVVILTFVVAGFGDTVITDASSTGSFVRYSRVQQLLN